MGASNSVWGERGKAHAALRLLLQGRISTMKCLEILASLAYSEMPDAPWEEVEWNEEFDPGVIAEEFFEVSTPEEWIKLKRELLENELISP